MWPSEADQSDLEFARRIGDRAFSYVFAALKAGCRKAVRRVLCHRENKTNPTPSCSLAARFLSL
jgi:hypothetical protein